MIDSAAQSGTPHPLCDEELACLAQAGSSSCFVELVRRHEGRLLAFLHRRTGHVQDAEDLLQETFVRAWQNLAAYNPRWRVTTWLYTIAARLACTHYRRSRGQVQADADIASLRCGQAGPHELASAHEERANLWATAERVLSVEQYTVLWLRYVEDMSVAGVAQVMGKTQTHVKVLLYRGRNNLAPYVRTGKTGGAPLFRPSAEPSQRPPDENRGASPIFSAAKEGEA